MSNPVQIDRGVEGVTRPLELIVDTSTRRLPKLFKVPVILSSTEFIKLAQHLILHLDSKPDSVASKPRTLSSTTYLTEKKERDLKFEVALSSAIETIKAVFFPWSF